MELIYEPIATRVLFGEGSVSTLPDEARRLGIERVLLITRREVDCEWAAAVFDGAAMHVPSEVVDHARARVSAIDADGLVAVALDAPTSLASLGMKESDLDRAAELATENPYYNPRPLSRDRIRFVLDDAFHGKWPRS